MQDKTKINLISTEVSGLWNTYINDSLTICTLKHFLNTLHDEEVRHILERALNISNSHLKVITDMFNQDGIPVPKGFGEDDVNMKAPKLYTDPFYLFYMLNLGQIGMSNYSLILNHIARPDVRNFFSSCIHESIELYNLTADALLQQGLYTKSPRVEFTKDVDFIDSESIFSGGWFKKKRSLLAREITVIFASIRQNIIGGALITGFGQVAQSKKLSKYFFRGRDLSWKKIEELNQFFINENIPIPSTSDSFVTDSTISPFSDKLMVFHIITLFAASMAQDGTGFSNVMRHDLQAHYSGSLLETAKYAEDGLDILIENNWMEQPPQVIEHRELAKV